MSDKSGLEVNSMSTVLSAANGPVVIETEENKPIVFVVGAGTATPKTVSFDGSSNAITGDLAVSGILTVTGRSKFTDGTPANPALQFTNDGDVGIWRDGQNVIGIATSGVGRWTWDGTGAFIQNATNGGTIVFGKSLGVIRSDTGASDTKGIMIASHGNDTSSNTEGAQLRLYGANEATFTGNAYLEGPGNLILAAGTAGSDKTINIQTMGVNTWAFLGTGGHLTQNGTNGGNIVLTKASTAVAQTVVNSISAAGTGQGDATALTGVINEVTTTAAATGVRLWEAPAGSVILIVNKGANALTIYPPTSGQIYGAAVNAGVTIAAAAYATCWKLAASGGNSWAVTETANA